MSADGMQIVMTATGADAARIAELEAAVAKAQGTIRGYQAEADRLRADFARQRAAFVRCRARLAIELDRGDRLATALGKAAIALAALSEGTSVPVAARRLGGRWEVSEDGDVGEAVPF